MCHAPIVVPTVAKEKATLCERTTRSMREVAQRACQTQPDRLVLISPHSPRLRANFCAWRGEHIGHLGRFGHPKLGIRLPDAPEVATTLDLPFVEEAAIEPHEHELDHGAVVPLLFLAEAGWHGPTSILSVPWEGNEHEAIGRALAALPGKTAVIASGDMSHRLKPGAPAGYHPKAQEFDLGFVEALERNDWAAAIRAPWQEDAAEDVVDSTRVALAAACQSVVAAELSGG